MTRKTQVAAPVLDMAAVDPNALYLVTLADRATLPHGEVLGVRPEPYEMRGRLLKAIASKVEGFELVPGDLVAE